MREREGRGKDMGEGRRGWGWRGEWKVVNGEEGDYAVIWGRRVGNYEWR